MNQMNQPQNVQQNQPLMNEPPQIISTKDHLYLTDMLSWNLTAMKKARFYAQQCQIPEVQAALDQAGQMHHRHYQQILKHLNANAQQMQ